MQRAACGSMQRAMCSAHAQRVVARSVQRARAVCGPFDPFLWAPEKKDAPGRGQIPGSLGRESKLKDKFETERQEFL